VLVVATRNIWPRRKQQYNAPADDERDLVIQGVLTFLDPPKETRTGRRLPPCKKSA
jgi:P-type Mg2+ transporter